MVEDILTNKNKTNKWAAMGKNMGSHFLLSGFNYYVLTLKLIIWYNGLVVYIHDFTLYFYFKNTCM